jgi:hypothetical protein
MSRPRFQGRLFAFAFLLSTSAFAAPQSSPPKPPPDPVALPKPGPDTSSPQKLSSDFSSQPKPASESTLSAKTAPTPASSTGEATLRISVRLPDDSPFSGLAELHVVTRQGSEIHGTKSETEGEMLYSNLVAGGYSIEAAAPGFLPVKQVIDIESGKRSQTVSLIMKPDVAVDATKLSDLKTGAPTKDTREPSASKASPVAPPADLLWAPPGVDAFVPKVSPGVSCSLPLVLEGVGQRMTQFVTNLQKFSATEHLEHYPISATGKRMIAQTRSFDYVAQITSLDGGMFSVEEYRNGGFDRTRFPANIATEGLPAMALIFHPLLAPDFNFACEGLGNWQGRPSWQIHFVQRTDRPSRIGGYRTTEHYYPFYLKGRAWIDAATYQVLRLETELAQPIPAVGLTEDLLIINYGSVTFRTRKQQLWLPQSAEMYMERHGVRFYRVHTFSDFKIFAVDTDQSIHAPKESYCFTNTSDRTIAGILTVSPASGISLQAVSIHFLIPPGGSIYKVVGPGKDVSMPVDQVGAATFVHNGPEGSIKADAYLVKESILDVIADSPVSVSQ